MYQSHYLLSNSNGFTLLEAMIVIAISSLLSYGIVHIGDWIDQLRFNRHIDQASNFLTAAKLYAIEANITTHLCPTHDFNNCLKDKTTYSPNYNWSTNWMVFINEETTNIATKNILYRWKQLTDTKLKIEANREQINFNPYRTSSTATLALCYNNEQSRGFTLSQISIREANLNITNKWVVSDDDTIYDCLPSYL